MTKTRSNIKTKKCVFDYVFMFPIDTRTKKFTLYSKEMAENNKNISPIAVSPDS
jgi:hypothetical protein